MASIDRIQNKKGISYKISVSLSYDASGEKILKSTTFVTESSRTEKQSEKEVQKFAVEFDEVKNGELL